MLRKSGKKAGHEKVVDADLTAKAIAKAVYAGDIVNFRLLFSPFSPARKDSPEQLETGKYAYLLPDNEMEDERRFHECLSQVRDVLVWAHIQRELDVNRPAQLPSDLVLQLADNAVRRGKYTSAAQAYELLRIRGRMQDVFFDQADVALDKGEVPKAVFGYIIAAGLEYDYAAFPEPLPAVPNFHSRALILHGDYPDNPDDAVGMQEPESFVQTALSYLLLHSEAATRLSQRPLEIRLAFLKELVSRRDPEWPSFIQRYREACAMVRQLGGRLGRSSDDAQGKTGDLAREIEDQLGADPRQIQARLLNRTIEGGEWWQYLKELAYKHPAAPLFVARQAVGDLEVLLPRHRPGSPAAQALGLDDGAQSRTPSGPAKRQDM